MVGLNFLRKTLFLLLIVVCGANCLQFSQEKIAYYRSRVKSMFYHAYNGYLKYAFPFDELKPLTCEGMDTWGSFSLTMVDALDTLLIMGNYTEFARASALVLDSIDFDANINVSVFETNIRVIGGLLSAHMLSGLAAREVPDLIELPPGWPCSGPLLTLAERVAHKLMPAFNSLTGMPYGTVNLKYGVHHRETPITCTAGVGTFLLEFTSLSRLTGNPHFERIAMKAMKELWKKRSPIGLVGNHINVQTGAWTATDSGIGAGVDSYFEYLVKAAIMFQKPDLMRQFYEYQKAIEKYVQQDDWFMWVSMSKGSVSMPVFQSLEAFWPGILSLIGDVDSAMRIILTYHQVLKQYGFVPEFFNIPNMEAVNKRSGYPLRPELIESVMYLYRATKDPQLLQIGVDMIEAIEHSTRTPCGYATVHNVKDHTTEDRMESFFLSETTKYLYLLFDPDNFIHNEGDEGLVVDTTNGKCVINAGGYVFNTEAHPLDPAVTYCCSERRQHEIGLIRDFEQNLNFLDLLGLETDGAASSEEFEMKDSDLPEEIIQLGHPLSNKSEMVIELPPNQKREEAEGTDAEPESVQVDHVVQYETEEIRKHQKNVGPQKESGQGVPGEVEDETEGKKDAGQGVSAQEIPHFGAKTAAKKRRDASSTVRAQKDERKPKKESTRKPFLPAKRAEPMQEAAAIKQQNTTPQKKAENKPNSAAPDANLKRTVENLLAAQKSLGLGSALTTNLQKSQESASNAQLADSIIKAFESVMKDWNKGSFTNYVTPVKGCLLSMSFEK